MGPGVFVKTSATKVMARLFWKRAERAEDSWISWVVSLKRKSRDFERCWETRDISLFLSLFPSLFPSSSGCSFVSFFKKRDQIYKNQIERI